MAATTDFVSLGTSTASAAATGFMVGGPIGAAVGGGLGFVSGLLGIGQNNAAAKDAELQAKRSKLSALELNKAREIERRMIGVNAATQRRQLVTQNAVQQANLRAAVAERGVAGGTAVQGARAVIGGGLATNFQTNLLSEAVGIELSNIKQNAANVATGVTGPQASKNTGGVKQFGRWVDKGMSKVTNWVGGLFS